MIGAAMAANPTERDTGRQGDLRALNEHLLDEPGSVRTERDAESHLVIAG